MPLNSFFFFFVQHNYVTVNYRVFKYHSTLCAERELSFGIINLVQRTMTRPWVVFVKRAQETSYILCKENFYTNSNIGIYITSCLKWPPRIWRHAYAMANCTQWHHIFLKSECSMQTCNYVTLWNNWVWICQFLWMSLYEKSKGVISGDRGDHTRRPWRLYRALDISHPINEVQENCNGLVLQHAGTIALVLLIKVCHRGN